MPLYEYQCESCGHRFETIQKFSDAPLGTCPKCGGAVRKLQSAPAFHLKGSGWYITDYARKDQGSGGKDKPSDSNDQGGKAAEKGESPAKAAEPAATPGKSDASTSTPAPAPSGSGPSTPAK